VLPSFLYRIYIYDGMREPNLFLQNLKVVMWRILFITLLLTVSAAAANIKLYMKDGNFHVVREYQKEPDRVRFYSIERADWEEVPLEMVDLKRTEEEVRQRQAALKEDAAAMDAEEKALREERREVSRIPVENGVFWVQGDAVKVMKPAEMKIVNNKRRSVLKAMSPIPIVAGQSTVELDGTNATITFANNRPEFYIRLAAEERFGILRLKQGKAIRVVQTWNIMPVTKELVEVQDNVEIFRKQIADGLYRIWPTKPIEPGEYAVVEYTEGKGNVQIWDFAVIK
jgi:hypothetical protein